MNNNSKKDRDIHKSSGGHALTKSTLDAVKDALVVLNVNLRVILVNHSFYHIFHIVPQEAEGQILSGLDNGQWNIIKLKTLLEEKSPATAYVRDFEVNQLNPAGHKILLLNFHHIRGKGGGADTILLTAEDITDHKQAEELLRQEEEKYHIFSENAMDGIHTIGLDSFEYVNSGFEEIVGHTRKESCNKNFNFNNLYHPEDRELIAEREKARKEEKNLPPVYLFRVISGDRALKHVEESTVPFSGEKVRVVSILRDITQHKPEKEALPESELKYCRFVENVNRGWVIDEDARDEIKEFSLKLENRIKERSKRIEILLNAKDSLQKEKSWEKGSKIIAESIEQLGFERYGIFVVNPVRNRLEFYSGKGVDLPKKGTSIPLRDSEHFGVKCVLEKRTIQKENTKKEKRGTSPNSCVWVPIVVQNEAFAALTADTVTKRTITDKDVKDLEVLAGMCAAFVDRTRTEVEPVAEQQSQKKLKYQLDPAEAYLVTGKNPEKALEIFYDLVTHGIPGFVISRAYPERLRKKYKLVKTPMMWLSRSEIENSISSDDLFELELIVEGFTKKSKESVILFDGLEYLMTQTNFEKVLRYMQELKDIAIINNSRLIIFLNKDSLSLREYSMLEREVITL